GSQQRLCLRELIGIHDPIAPRSVHVHEIDTMTGIARAYLRPAQHYRFSRRNTGNDPGVEARPGSFDFPVRERSRHEYSHAAGDDLVACERALGFNHVRLKGRVIEQTSPNAKSCTATHDLVPQTLWLDLETFRKIGFRDWSPVHTSPQVSFRSLEPLPASRRI